jgi:hypothetical protein
MNWIYNWYDPHGKLSVNDLVDNVTRLFLAGFAGGTLDGDAPAASKSSGTERPSVWREVAT